MKRILLLMIACIWTSFAYAAGKDGFYEKFSTDVTVPAEADLARKLIDLEGGGFNNPDSVETVLYIDSVSFKPAKAAHP